MKEGTVETHKLWLAKMVFIVFTIKTSFIVILLTPNSKDFSNGLDFTLNRK